MNENKWEPVDVEALIAQGDRCESALRGMDMIGSAHDVRTLIEALRALAAELDKERLAGKNTANMMLDMATENKSLRAELAALRAQEPTHYVVLDEDGEIMAADKSKEALCSRGIAKAFGPVVGLFASPVVPPVAEENRTLRLLCGAAYQAIGAADGPLEMLDNLADAANGHPLRHDPMAGLPWVPAYPEAAAPGKPAVHPHYQCPHCCAIGQHEQDDCPTIKTNEQEDDRDGK